MAAAKWHCFAEEGDTDSLAPPRTQNKITKPKTNNSTSNLLQLKSSSSQSGSAPATPPKDIPGEQYGIPELGTEGAFSAGDRRNKLDYRSNSTSPFNAPEMEDHRASAELEEDDEDPLGVHNKAGAGLGGFVTGMKKRLSRPASQKSLAQLPSATASSTLLSSYPSKFSLIAEHEDQVEESAQDPERSERTSSGESTPKNNRDSMPNALVRRRTMLMPGVATRGQPSDILRKPPPPDSMLTQADRDYYYNPSYSESSPLGALASLNSAHDRCQSPISQRAMTPSDLDYSHLHGFMRGSLRITNGAASPDPGCDMQQDYFSPLSKLNAAQRTCSPLGERSPDIAMLRGHSSKSSLQLNIDLAFARTSGRLSNLGHAETRVPDDATSMFDNDSHAGLDTPIERTITPKPTLLPVPKTPDTAADIAQDYQNELPLSPFSFTESHLGSPRPDTNARVARHNDEFQDEGVVTSPVKSAPHSWMTRTGDRPDLSGELDGSSAQRLSPVVRAIDSRSPSVKSLSDRRSTYSTALAKSDSGYSSRVSLRSFERGHRLEEREQASSEIDPQDSISERIDVQPSGSHPEPPSRAAPPPPPPPPAVPPKDDVESEIIAPSSASIRLRKRLSMPSIRYSDTIFGFESIAPPLPSHRKLQKSRRSSQLLLTPAPCDPSEILVVANREIDDTLIPPVPVEVAASLAERLRKFPALEHTYLSLDHITSDDEKTADIESQPRGRQPTQLTLDDRPAAHRSVTRLNAERRNSTKTIVYEDSYDMIADFGTVAESLGASPYDLAMQAAGVDMSTRRRSAISPSGWYPHQIGAISNARHSVIGMDGESAAALAREKSKDVARRGEYRRSTGSRPRSYGEDRLGSASPPRRSGQRPKSMFVGQVPPMPALPRIQEQPSTSFDAAAVDEESEPSREEVPASPPCPAREAPPTPTLDAAVNMEQEMPPSPPCPAREAPPTPTMTTPTPTTTTSLPTTPRSWEDQAAAWSARRRSVHAALHRPLAVPAVPSSLAFPSSKSGPSTPTGRYTGSLAYSYGGSAVSVAARG